MSVQRGWLATREERIVIRACDEDDFEAIWSIINDGAEAYRGVIPADRWVEPYMSREELGHEIEAGVRFWGVEAAGGLAGVMGVQTVEDVTLIRHAYVRSEFQRRGIGGQLLAQLRASVQGPVLIGTWADARWAIEFYQAHGFHVVDTVMKERLLRRYWTVPERQIESSVVLVESRQAKEGD